MMRGVVEDRVRLALLVFRSSEEASAKLLTEDGEWPARVIFSRYGVVADRYLFDLPIGLTEGWYELDGARVSVATDYEGDEMRIAFVSCNGQEQGDLDRKREDRNTLWSRLKTEHQAAPLHLLLQGGDQIYADEILDAHPATRRWEDDDDYAGNDVTAEDLENIRTALSRSLFARYLVLLGHDEAKSLLRSVPTLSMWDDHDICDGWGSLAEAKLDSPVGQTVFEVAREHFLLFQQASTLDDLPETMMERAGSGFGMHVELPGLHVVIPDFRSERRPDRVMTEEGWRSFDESLKRAAGSRVLFVSTIPVLGPRLSLVESTMNVIPGAQKYEDDLRDQWQSRHHRAEWTRMLKRLVRAKDEEGTEVTILSGEIHLATRGTLACNTGTVHQLVASGITHDPPPRGWARTLGALAWLGDSPLPDHPIRMRSLPGHPRTYCDQRNYLRLLRKDGRWRAWWETEEDGTSEPLDLGSVDHSV
ncbi:alkaline phosphatase D family protein [Notoacmeibacter ruber]|uniref:Alkaline phosphatase family protein n=1 Tax=Notoacmeibacter ruber TaxID=2670375 RepID=A0A3L7J9P9_9HYPH|nr:alkaline phosphatase D family protein [Notoacmeibacter ruber]RLQ87336.1 alkaline phosphatase family protein [Notoacmeibacter ruber]